MWTGPEASNPAVEIELAPAWRHVWARLIGGRDRLVVLPTTTVSADDAEDAHAAALLSQLGWCGAEWVRPPPEGQLAIGDAACGVEEVAAISAAYQLAAMAASSPVTRKQLVETVLTGGHAAYHAGYALAALPSMAAGSVIDGLLGGLDSIEEMLDAPAANLAVAHSVFVLVRYEIPSISIEM